MKKFIVVGVLALVVIGCVLAAGCTSTTSNGNASGYMIPADEYLGSDLGLQLGDNIDLKLIDELEYRMGSNQLTQAEFAQAFGTTTQAEIKEILGKQSYSASGTMTDVEMQETLEKKLAGTKVLLGNKNLDNISEWSNNDLMDVIKLRVANKDQTVYEAMKVAGTMPADLLQNTGIYIKIPGNIRGTTAMGYSEAALKEASQLSGTMRGSEETTVSYIIGKDGQKYIIYSGLNPATGAMTEGTTENWDIASPDHELFHNHNHNWEFRTEGDLSEATGVILDFESEMDMNAASSDASKKRAEYKKKSSAATGAMTDNLNPSDVESIDILTEDIIEEVEVEPIWIFESEGDLSAASGTMTNWEEDRWNPILVFPFNYLV